MGKKTEKVIDDLAKSARRLSRKVETGLERAGASVESAAKHTALDAERLVRDVDRRVKASASRAAHSVSQAAQRAEHSLAPTPAPRRRTARASRAR